MGKYCHLSNKEVNDLITGQIQSITTIIERTSATMLTNYSDGEYFNMLHKNKKQLLEKIDVLTEMMVKLNLNEFQSHFEQA